MCTFRHILNVVNNRSVFLTHMYCACTRVKTACGVKFCKKKGVVSLNNPGVFDFSHRDNKLTMLLRESLGNINCRTTMIAHISDSPANYAETLTTVQLASRIHRMRKKKSKVGSQTSRNEFI